MLIARYLDNKTLYQVGAEVVEEGETIKLTRSNLPKSKAGFMRYVSEADAESNNVLGDYSGYTVIDLETASSTAKDLNNGLFLLQKYNKGGLHV